MSTFFDFSLERLSEINIAVLLNILSDSVDVAGMHKYFLLNSGIGDSSPLTYKIIYLI